MIEGLILLACVGAGTVGGVFFGFSSFIMRALSELPTAQGVAAMQRINVVVLNPVFLTLFIGTAVLGVACVVVAFFPWSTSRSPLLIAAGASSTGSGLTIQHLLGCETCPHGPSQCGTMRQIPLKRLQKSLNGHTSKSSLKQTSTTQCTDS